jgi:hypothetical protein
MPSGAAVSMNTPISLSQMGSAAAVVLIPGGEARSRTLEAISQWR